MERFFRLLFISERKSIIMAQTILDTITLVGNVSLQKDGFYAAKGDIPARFAFSVACTPSTYNASTHSWDEGNTNWHRVTAWGALAENLNASLTNGTQVIVIGHNKTDEWEDKTTHEKRTATSVVADYAGVSLRFCKVDITKTTRGGASQPAAPAAETAQAPTPADTPAPANTVSENDSNYDDLFN